LHDGPSELRKAQRGVETLHDGRIGRPFESGEPFKLKRYRKKHAPLWFLAAMVPVTIEVAVAAGGTLASWCMAAFVFIGGGTAATYLARRLQ
jgi:hypothetical protein